MVAMHLEKPICALLWLSEVSLMLLLKHFQYLSDWQWLLSCQKESSSASFFHTSLDCVIACVILSKNGLSLMKTTIMQSGTRQSHSPTETLSGLLEIELEDITFSKATDLPWFLLHTPCCYLPHFKFLFVVCLSWLWIKLCAVSNYICVWMPVCIQ